MSSGNGSKKVKTPYKFNTVQLHKLKAHPKQSEVRVISDEALQGLGNFIDKVGLVEEIAINERTGHIISGHQRCKVLIDKGFTSAKVKVFDVDEDTEDLMFMNLNSQVISGAFTDEAKPCIQSLEARLGSEMYQEVGLQMLEVSLAESEQAVGAGLAETKVDDRGQHGKYPKDSANAHWNDSRSLSVEGYVKLRVGRSHPLGDPNGYAYEHLVIFAAASYVYPDSNMVIHHKNGDRQDNRFQNLELLSRAQHNIVHNKEKKRDDRGRFMSREK